MNWELDPVDRITTDAVGEPGDRTFFLQVRSGERVFTLVVEKQQVQLLGRSIVEILATVGRETGEGPGEDALALEAPIEPLWRVGRLSIGYAEDRDRMVLELEEMIPAAEDDGDDDEDEEGAEPTRTPDRIRAWATREQMFALARHGAMVASRGRPLCDYCGNPIQGPHKCPAMNGHGPG